MHYLLSDRALRQHALQRGIDPTGTAVARMAGMQPWTVNALLQGRPASAKSMARLTALFGVPVEALFERVECDDGLTG